MPTEVLVLEPTTAGRVPVAGAAFVAGRVSESFGEPGQAASSATATRFASSTIRVGSALRGDLRMEDGSVPGQDRRVLRKLTVGGLLVAAAVAYGLTEFAPPSAGEQADAGLVPSGVYSLRRGDLLYTYHAPTDSEALFDLRTDPRCLHSLAGSRPEERDALHHALARELGVVNLQFRTLPAPPRRAGTPSEGGL